jgi:pilus assembly protein CpaC
MKSLIVFAIGWAISGPRSRKMKTFFKKFSHCSDVFELKCPTSFLEKVRGLFGFSHTPKNFAVVYKSPCILHTFGMNRDIWMLELNQDLEPVLSPQRCPPNSIFFAGSKRRWIAECVSEPKGYAHLASSQRKSSWIMTLPESILPKGMCSQLMRSAFLLLILLIGFLFSNIGWAAKGPIKMPVGENKEVQLEQPPRSLDISQPDVVDVQRIGNSNKILVTGLRSGTSKLTAKFQNGTTRDWFFQVGVQDSPSDSQPTLSSSSLLRLARELQRRAGFETVIDNGRIVIFGNLLNEAQFKAVLDACLGRDECLPRYYQNDEASKIQRDFFATFFKQSGKGNLEIENIPGGIKVVGSVADEESLSLARVQLRSVLNRYIENIQIDKSGAALVESQLTFFRMNVNQLDALGVTPSAKSAEQGSELIRAGISDFVRSFRNGPKMVLKFPDLVLTALAHKGVLNQLAQPSLVVASGGKGEVQAGGEWLFQSQGQHQKFFSQNYGLTVTIQPQIVVNDIIKQKIDIRISSPSADSSANSNAISSLDQSVLSTEITTRANEQILLTRINQKTKGKSVSKVPILGHVPILGEIFKSRESHDNGSELWIAIRNRLGSSETPPQLEVNPNPDHQTPSHHWLD